jgi:hypothetical protein
MAWLVRSHGVGTGVVFGGGGNVLLLCCWLDAGIGNSAAYKWRIRASGCDLGFVLQNGVFSLFTVQADADGRGCS